jgi:RNA polymerase sigma-70 factor (ECF subfamily)
MDATRLTLLQQAAGGQSQAWGELDRLYRPFLRSWFRVHDVPAPDAEDLTQDVLAALHQELPVFEHSGRAGAFRTWLRTACLHRLLGHRRAEGRRGRPVGGSDFQERLDGIEGSDPNVDAWDREHDQAVLRHLFSRVSEEFEPATLEAFRRLAINEQPVAEVATALGITAGAVYVAKSRVLRRLREEAIRLLGDDLSA